MGFHPRHIHFIAAGLLLALAAAQAGAQSATPDESARSAALQLEQQGNISEAESAWRDISSRSPRNPEPYAHLASLASRSEHYDQAVPLYRKAISLAPDMPALRLNLGLALFQSGRLAEAISEFELVRKSLPAESPESLRVTILLGMSHYGLKQYQQAVPFLRDATTHDPENLPLRMALAHSCLWSKQYQCVLDAYQEILRMNAESAEADMLAGEALDEMKDPAGAAKMFRAAVTANPREPNVHFGYGYLLWKDKQFDQAAAEFQAELANDPRHSQSLLYLGDCFLQLNKPAEARPLLEKALELDPSLWRANLDLGILDADAGRNDDALRQFQAAARLNPNEINVHWRLGKLYRTMGRKEESKAEFDKASSLSRSADEDLYQKMGNAPSDSPGQNPNATKAPN